MKVINELLGYTNRKIYQDTEMFNFTLDSILLARFFKPSSKIKKIVDLGTNNAVIPLIVSKYTNAKITGVEINDKAVVLANENIEMNGLENQINVVCSDIKDFANENVHQFDVVICNPPFFKVGEKTKTREISQEVANARHENLITLEQIIESGAKLINNGGSFLMVHRAERVTEIINFYKEHNLIVKRIQFIYSKADKEAKTVLIEGIKQGNEGVIVLPPLIAHNDDETYTDELLEYFRD